MGNKGYGCSNYKLGCKFVIWKESLGKTLTPAMIRSLIGEGHTNKLKLTDRSGAQLEGCIVLRDRNTGQVDSSQSCKHLNTATNHNPHADIN
jgi:DNA topoisomerase-3